MLHKHFLQQLTSAHWQALAASFPSLCASQHFQLCDGCKKSVPSRSESYTTIWMIGKNLCCFVVNKFHALPLAAWRLASVMWLHKSRLKMLVISRKSALEICLQNFENPFSRSSSWGVVSDCGPSDVYFRLISPQKSLKFGKGFVENHFSMNSQR